MIIEYKGFTLTFDQKLTFDKQINFGIHLAKYPSNSLYITTVGQDINVDILSDKYRFIYVFIISTYNNTMELATNTNVLYTTVDNFKRTNTNFRSFRIIQSSII